jgi:hypothetical protein
LKEEEVAENLLEERKKMLEMKFLAQKNLA